MGTSALALAGEVIDLNYPDLQEVFPVGPVEAFSFPNAKLIEKYGNVTRSLLTDDVDDIRVVVNSYLILANSPGLRPRAEIEMPQLVSTARELIASLNEEYPH